MAVLLRPEMVRRYRDMAVLLVKYGRSDLLRSTGIDSKLAGPPLDGAEEGHSRDADRLAADLERMGPAFVKLGQLMSTRSDMFPPEVLESLSRLQDELEPMPFDVVERILNEELPVRLSKAFESFEPDPVAAASLGQVHRARLRDGRLVAVKIQREGIREVVRRDLEALDRIATFLEEHTRPGEQYRLKEMFVRFRDALLGELDYRTEATNMRIIAGNLTDLDGIVVPLPVDDYTTERVLTMDYVRGRKVTALSPLARMEMDGSELADQLMEAYLKQVLIDGFFHADPHPGNVFLTDDRRIALIDLGMVERVTPRLRDSLLRLLLAASEGKGEDAADQALRMARLEQHANRDLFRTRVADIIARQQYASLEHMQVGAILLELYGIAADCGVRLPAELSVLGKTLLNLDLISTTLDPSFDPNASIRRHAGEVMRQHMMSSLTPGALFSNMLEVLELVQRLPSRVNRALEGLERGELRLRLHAIDEPRLMNTLRSLANRITLGLLVAALIIGAALMARVETSGQILGYPAIAFVLFMAGAIAAIALGIQIVWFDRDESHE
ncbi:MAG TPA: AarF/UbiB family protein [Longimicrobiales bacterium]|nr:AarF/UbiB family protein [Longimicrobiales bacterium]